MDKLAIVTGGSRGIGAAIAVSLAEEGYRVAIIYNKSAEAAHALTAAANSAGHDMRAYQVNVGDSTALLEVLGRIYAEMGHCSLLVNNAATAMSQLLMDTTPSQWRDMMSINLDSVYVTTKAVIPQMLALGSGNIINIGSVWGSHGAACEVAYSATKGAIISLTRSLSREVGGNGIRVNSISPGYIATDMTAGYSAEEVADIIDDIPLARLGCAADVADLVLFLASDRASYITGQDIVIDGGWQS